MKVALVQAQLAQSEAQANRTHLARVIEQLPATVDLIVLPETFATGFLGEGEREPENMSGESVRWMQDQARRRNCAICGSLIIGDRGQRFNRFVYVSATGGVIAAYNKRHLFGYGGEDQRYSAGQERVVFEYQGWRLCPQICYDLRFPVWSRNQNDYDLLIYVANWPIKRVAAWKLLLQARAVENQAYVIGVNRAGPDGQGVIYGGCSGVYDPLGQGLVELGSQPGVAVIDIDLNKLGEVRESLPFLKDGDAFSLKALIQD